MSARKILSQHGSWAQVFVISFRVFACDLFPFHFFGFRTIFDTSGYSTALDASIVVVRMVGWQSFRKILQYALVQLSFLIVAFEHLAQDHGLPWHILESNGRVNAAPSSLVVLNKLAVLATVQAGMHTRRNLLVRRLIRQAVGHVDDAARSALVVDDGLKLLMVPIPRLWSVPNLDEGVTEAREITMLVVNKLL